MHINIHNKRREKINLRKVLTGREEGKKSEGIMFFRIFTNIKKEQHARDDVAYFVCRTKEKRII